MKKKLLTKAVSVLVVAAMCSGGTSAWAAAGYTPNGQESGLISPWYIAIISCSNNLTLNTGGKLTCEGETEVQSGYTAGVLMELQKYNGSTWSTIKSWSGSKAYNVYLSQDWYVEKGSYRLQLTHTAKNSSGTVVETVVKYSKTVTY